MVPAIPTPPEPRPKLLRAPLVPLALAVILGIAAGRFSPVPVSLWAIAAALFLAAAVRCLFRKHLTGPAALCAALAVLALAAIHGNLAYRWAPANALVSYTGPAPIPATVTGRIVSVPQTDGQGILRRTRLLMEADSIGSSGRPADVTGILRVGVRGGNEQLAPGDRVEIVGWLGWLRPPDNPGQYDWAANARTTNSLAAMEVHSPDGVRVLGSEGPLSRWLWRWRSAARSHLAAADPDTNRLLTALLIGDRHPALRDLNRAMMRAGTVHILSISGAHLAIFMGFVYLLCRAFAVSPRRAAAVALAVLVLYMLLAEPQPALLRSAIMAACLCIGTIAGRRNTALNSLAAAAILLLAFDPMQLFDVGLQLSFTMVAGLILLSRPIRDAIFGRWRRRRGLIVFRGRRRIARWWAFTAADWFHNAVAMSLAATIASMPLVALHFGLFSPYAPLLSLILSPLVAAILVPSYLSLALAALLPNVSAALAQFSAWVAQWFVQLCWSFDRLPGLCMALRPVDLGWVAAWYLAVALWALRDRLKLPRWWITCAAVIVAVYGGYTQRPASRPAALELDLLSVGPGQTALIRTPEGQTYLIDAGTGVRRSDGPDLLEGFRRVRRLPAPRAAFLSHANADHYSVLAADAPPRTYLSDHFGGPGTPSTAVDFLESLQSRSELLRLHAGKTIDLDSRTRVEVLWPPAQPPADLNVNDTSLVLRIVCDGRSILFPGDLEAVGQAALTADPKRLRSDVLVLPHHGHWRKTLPAFVSAVDPKLVLVSDGTEPRPPVKDPDAARFYSQLSTSRRLHATHRQGWLHLTLTDKLPVETMRP